ncbi:MAG: hypothetical protein ABSE73_17895, partial [Planctomycetota bacterium]
MLRRALLIIILAWLCMFALQSCTNWYSWYSSMQLVQVGDKPYLVLEHRAASPDANELAFSIYRTKSDNLEEWEGVETSRLGRVYGVFAARLNSAPLPAAAEKAEPGPERLVVLHQNRATFFDVSAKTATPTFEMLPFSWIAETVVPYKGAWLAFGVDMPPRVGKEQQGPLKVARFDGQKWEELKIASPLVLESPYGFSLQAVAVQDCIRVFWRQGATDQALAPEIEGPRSTTEGGLTMATFQDGAFVGDKLVTLAGLPRGNTCVWAEGSQLKVLVQRRDKREDPFTSNGPMEIWNLAPDGSTQLAEALPGSRQRNGLVAFIAAEHFTWRGQEFIVRSNWQTFEIWRKTAESGWSRVCTAPKGLPAYDLGGLMLAALACALALIAFGAGLAYHRRRQVVTILHKIQASEIYASLGMRMGAFAVDLALIIPAAWYLNRVLGRTYVTPVEMLWPDF